MRFASLAPHCGRLQPLLQHPVPAPHDPNAPEPTQAVANPSPLAKPHGSLEDWVQRARGCGAL